MARLKYEDVQAEINSTNWTLVSKEYQNLEADLEMQCQEGHRVFISLKKWRRTPMCPICEKEHTKLDLKKNIPPKRKGVKRILALDDATGTSGWSLFDGDTLISYGHITFTDSDTIDRIVKVRQWLISVIHNWQPDVVGIEDIHLEWQGKYTNVVSFKVLAQLQGALLVTLAEERVHNTIVHPSTWRSTCGINAKTKIDKKKMAQDKVREWYNIHATQDEAEAICIGRHLSLKYVKNDYMITWGG